MRIPAKRGPKRSARTENPRTIAVAATTLMSNMLTVLAPDNALVRTSYHAPSPNGGKPIAFAPQMTCFIDSFKNQRGAIAINDTLLTMVIVANTRFIAMDSGTSFKAVANHL